MKDQPFVDGEIPRIDPDPLALLLVALGAAGSIASLLSLAQPVLQQKRRENAEWQSGLADAVAGAEMGIVELQGFVRALEIAVTVSLAQTAPSQRPGPPASFGQVTVLLPPEAFHRWERLQFGITAGAHNLLVNFNQILLSFAVSSKRLPERSAERLRITVDHLNGTLRELGQLPFDVLLTGVTQGLEEARIAIRGLRDDLREEFGLRV